MVSTASSGASMPSSALVTPSMTHSSSGNASFSLVVSHRSSSGGCDMLLRSEGRPSTEGVVVR